MYAVRPVTSDLCVLSSNMKAPEAASPLEARPFSVRTWAHIPSFMSVVPRTIWSLILARALQSKDHTFRLTLGEVHVCFPPHLGCYRSGGKCRKFSGTTDKAIALAVMHGPPAEAELTFPKSTRHPSYCSKRSTRYCLSPSLPVM